MVVPVNSIGGTEADFSDNPDFNDHLGLVCFRALAHKPWRTVLIERTQGRKALKAGILLAVAYTIARYWRDTVKEERIGLLLPPGAGGLIANLAALWAGKVPVNLNYTLGADAFGACLDTAEIRTLVTAKALRQKFPSLHYPKDVRYLEEDCKQYLPGVPGLLLLALRASLFPRGLMNVMELEEKGGDREAALLFSSGSEGSPKGVVLTHRNLLGNIAQIKACGALTRRQKMLGCLPIFHSFGFTVTLWYALLEELTVISLPSPLEHKRIGKVIQEEQVNIFISTPTFLRPHLNNTPPDRLASLKITIAGAEKTPQGLAEAWEQKFGSEYLEGYGLSETSPVVSVNLPRYVAKLSRVDQPIKRMGSVGPLIPGLAARIVSPETGKDLPFTETGLLYLRGVNIFPGYLKNAEATSQALDQGWFNTGDLACFDKDGFLFIKGRLKRFSKIGGEMVPHGAVEQQIAALMGVELREAPVLAICGKKHSSKGEQLVLLCTMELNFPELLEKLRATDLPKLWLPKSWLKVEAIPTLASGKLDLQSLQALAEGKMI